MKSLRLTALALVTPLVFCACQTDASDGAAGPSEPGPWTAMFNGENLDGMTVRGGATWTVVDGVLTGESKDGQGHIYMGPELTNLEARGMFRITSQGETANSGLYFRANEPKNNPDGYPTGYEAQICHDHDAPTGWLWKPGTPTGPATKVITKDGEWFSMRIRAVGAKIEIWINDELVMAHEDREYKKGSFALQCHNPGMQIQAKALEYRSL